MLLQALARRGFHPEVLSGTFTDSGAEQDPAAWLRQHGQTFEAGGGETWTAGAAGVRALAPPCLRLSLQGVPITIVHRPLHRAPEPDQGEIEETLRLLEDAFERLRPELLLTCGADPLTREVLARARRRGIATVFTLHDFALRSPEIFAAVDAVLVPSCFAAEYYAFALGLSCTVLPQVVEWEHVRVERREPRFVTFVNPSIEQGVYAFARIADELGRKRPDIPLLVVERQGTEATLGGCGLDLRVHRTVNLMSPTSDPRPYWAATRICLLPSLAWESQPQVAVEALINGIPVLGSDRAGIPETLGAAGMVLPLPERLTPATRMLPTPEEMAPWVEALIRLWDDADLAAEHRRRALTEAERWAPDIVEPQYVRFFERLLGAAERSAAGTPSTSLSGGRRRGGAPPGNAPEPDLLRERLQTLAAAFPWPAEKPEVEDAEEHPGWLGGGTDLLLARELSAETRVVVELGAWLGLSTRFMAEHAPKATVISIDHWQGSPEHRAGSHFQGVLPLLFERFLAACWSLRARIIPLRMTTLAGLEKVAESGLQPELIYVDAEHSFAAVTAELEACRRWFPQAVIVGDDFDWEGVQRAVSKFAVRQGLGVERVGARGWKLLARGRTGALAGGPPPSRAKAVVLVPHLQGIEWECEESLRRLEQDGVRVVRRIGSSQIDLARSELASDALHDGAESLLFIDADLGFEPREALRLLTRPEAVVAGIYAKKSRRELASVFAEGVSEVVFGSGAPGLYPLKYAATGFLRIRTAVLRKLIAELELPLCNTKWGRGVWPFFQPLIVPHAEGGFHYLGEDWAFSQRLSQIGITPLADTSIRLWHYGRYGFGWEDAGADPPRYRTYRFRP